MVSGKTKIKNPTGLHLRPAGLFCKTAMQFASKITVRKQARNEEVTANAKSVLSVLGACIKSGDEIEVICEGSDETAALAEMIRIIEDGLENKGYRAKEKNMNKATLVVMAAGIGSRFGGGIKQLEPVGPNGEIIMDYSIYDAMEAGFDKVVFVIRKDLEKDFKEVIGNRIEKVVEVAYAYQEVDDIPQAYRERFSGRTKPWGTGQAILCCKDVVDSPFLVINADDYYGKQAYVEAYEYLTRETTSKDEICMVSFVLKNTLSDNGGVTRGVCKVNENGYLADIVETSNIEKYESGAAVHKGEEYISIDIESSVSMNMWGLTPEFFQILESGFEAFVANTPADNLKAEYLLPTIIGDLLAEKKLAVKVLTSKDKWFGVTYKEDKDSVVSELQALIHAGVYPKKLF